MPQRSSSSPHVLLDATALPEVRGGVGRYVDELAAALDRRGAELAVVCQVRDAEHYAQQLPHAEIVAAPAAIARRPVRLAWEQAALPALARRLSVQVVHGPHYTMPLRSPVPVVTTLHDATFFTHPEVHQAVKRVFFRAWTRASLRCARRCIVPSRATLLELQRVTGLVRDQVDVVPHGVNGRTFRAPTEEQMAAARRALGVRAHRYVAFLGTIEPRKNVPTLVDGWRRAFSDWPDAPALVVVGARGWDRHVDEALSAVPPHLEVRLPGYLPHHLLSGFLGGADVLAFPSSGEGFGLPVLEAMACGTPVLTTPTPALVEVGGGAVEYAEPTAQGLAAALQRLVSQPERRARLSAMARVRAAGFDWDTAAEQHLDTYARAAGSRSRLVRNVPLPRPGQARARSAGAGAAPAGGADQPAGPVR